MKIVLSATNDKGKVKYLESYDGLTGTIKFTQDPTKAKVYASTWFSDAELMYLKFHFQEASNGLVNNLRTTIQEYDNI